MMTSVFKHKIHSVFRDVMMQNAVIIFKLSYIFSVVPSNVRFYRIMEDITQFIKS